MESSAAPEDPGHTPPDQSAGPPGPGVTGIADDGGRSGPYDKDPAALRRRVHPLTVVATTAAILAIAGSGVLVILTHGFHKRTKLTYQVPAVFKLHPGECFNSGQNDVDLTLRSCSTPHDAEVFATFPATGTSAWPGDAALRADAESGCSVRIAGYMNPTLATALDQEFIYPDVVAWRAGVRTVICDVRSATGPITGSVRQSP